MEKNGFLCDFFLIAPVPFARVVFPYLCFAWNFSSSFRYASFSGAFFFLFRRGLGRGDSANGVFKWFTFFLSRLPT